MQPLVSVIIPTLNRSSQLQGAVLSVFKQTYRPLEIVIVDDFSAVPVASIEFAFEGCDAGVSIKVIRNETRIGAAASRNKGVQASLGDFYCFLDDDDIYNEKKIEKLIHPLKNDSSIDAAFGRVRLILEDRQIQLFSIPEPFDYELNVVVMNLVHNNSTLIRRRVANNVRFLESLTRYQDTQFNIELLLKVKTIYVAEFVADWRVDEREDKITFDGNAEKSRRDVVALTSLYFYLIEVLRVDRRLLGIYLLKLIRMKYRLGCPTINIFSDLCRHGLLNLLFIPRCVAKRRSIFLQRT